MQQSVCSESGSFDIPAALLAGSIEEAVEAQAIAVKRQEGSLAQVNETKSTTPLAPLLTALLVQASSLSAILAAGSRL